jgi:hypothetical protein
MAYECADAGAYEGALEGAYEYADEGAYEGYSSSGSDSDDADMEEERALSQPVTALSFHLQLLFSHFYSV